MKKTRFLALTSLCSVLAGMPVNAGKIKDSDAKKIGGVENSSNSEGDKDLEEKNKTMNKKGKISHFVDLVKSHPIWLIIIGSGSVAVEEGIRRKLHSKQETSLVIYKPAPKVKFANEYVHNIFYSSLYHDVKEFLDDECVKNKILKSFFNFTFTVNPFFSAYNKLRNDKQGYYLKRKLTLGTNFITEKCEGLKSLMGRLEEIGVTFKFVAYMKKDNFDISYLYVDVIAGEKTIMTKEICYFNI